MRAYMKKIDLCKLALLGITLGLTTGAISPTSTDVSQQLLADASERYVCSSYQNCGKCGGACNFKNPKTPGLTPEEVKKAEEYQKEHGKDKGATATEPSAPGQEKCGSFCASSSGDDADASNENSSAMRAKRQNFRN